MRHFPLRRWVPALLLLLPFYAVAQKSDTARVEVTKVKKFKPPVVKVVWGKRSNGDTVTVPEANELIGLPLKVTDDKNGVYTVSSYHLLYKRKGSILNQETGRERVIFTTVSDIFKETPLPEGWIKGLKGYFQSDEELLFFDIVVKDQNNRIFFAPNLKLYIE